MNKWQAIHNFWSGFGIPAYDENTVPDRVYVNGVEVDNKPPYITYSAAVGEFEQVVQLTASVWYQSTSWSDVSNKVDEISRSIDQYKLIKIDDGYMFMVKGTPFAQRMSDENDTLRRIYVNIQAEFFTNY